MIEQSETIEYSSSAVTRRELHRKQQSTYYYKLRSTEEGHKQFNEMHRQRTARTRAKSARRRLAGVRDGLYSRLSASQRADVETDVERHRERLASAPDFHLMDADYKEDIREIRLENKIMKYEVRAMKKVLGDTSKDRQPEPERHQSLDGFGTMKFHPLDVYGSAEPVKTSGADSGGVAAVNDKTSRADSGGVAAVLLTLKNRPGGASQELSNSQNLLALGTTAA